MYQTQLFKEGHVLFLLGSLMRGLDEKHLVAACERMNLVYFALSGLHILKVLPLVPQSMRDAMAVSILSFYRREKETKGEAEGEGETESTPTCGFSVFNDIESDTVNVVSTQSALLSLILLDPSAAVVQSINPAMAGIDCESGVVTMLGGETLARTILKCQVTDPSDPMYGAFKSTPLADSPADIRY
ncbi:hypothetical protein KIPB_010034 [Kipferlia bialata]|uniref:Prenyltransferase alpha-alpha toroid domain-containing protein n=1 Tax=Kipferlia bialata TaxID=797122 RepID=A0A9K3GM25_9EUKA|nr:hypothetical protein KIPB_010034 [Kipferlia bialata]|eukprot:g10034.t1